MSLPYTVVQTLPYSQTDTQGPTYVTAPLHLTTTYLQPEHQGALDFEEQYKLSGRREKEKDETTAQIAKLAAKLGWQREGNSLSRWISRTSAYTLEVCYYQISKCQILRSTMLLPAPGWTSTCTVMQCSNGDMMNGSWSKCLVKAWRRMLENGWQAKRKTMLAHGEPWHGHSSITIDSS